MLDKNPVSGPGRGPPYCNSRMPLMDTEHGVTSSDVYNKITSLMIWKTNIFFSFACVYVGGKGEAAARVRHKDQNPSKAENAHLSKREKQA